MMDAAERPKEIEEVRAMALVQHRKSQIEASGPNSGDGFDSTSLMNISFDESEDEHIGILLGESSSHLDAPDAEELNYLALDIVQHLAPEKLQRLLANLQEHDAWVQDVVRRNSMLTCDVQRLTEENRLLQSQLDQVVSPAVSTDSVPSALVPCANWKQRRSLSQSDIRQVRSRSSSLKCGARTWRRDKENQSQPNKGNGAKLRLGHRLERALQSIELKPNRNLHENLHGSADGTANISALQADVERLTQRNEKLEAQLNQCNAELEVRTKTLEEVTGEIRRLKQPRNLTIRLNTAKYDRRKSRLSRCDSGEANDMDETQVEVDAKQQGDSRETDSNDCVSSCKATSAIVSPP
jgi:hypothetical protein